MNDGEGKDDGRMDRVMSRRSLLMNSDETQFRPSDSATPLCRDDETTYLSIPGFKLVAELGKGGMATVYEGFDLRFSPPRHVAIKFMHTGISQNPEFRARFDSEAAVVSSFRHDGIIRVYATDEVDGAKYIVMEYLSGGTLAEKLQLGPLSLIEALTTAATLADALAYSHARGVVHRDVKPGNVLFTSDGKPVLSDFGVAKNVAAADANLTQFAMVIGAPRYMSPEQAQVQQVTDRSDVYSLGLTLFEMLTGDVPSASMRVQGSKSEQITGAQLLAIPARIGALISRCLMLQPELRPTAAECHRELVEVAQSIQTGDSARSSVAAICKSRRFLYASLAMVAALLVAGSYYRFVILPSRQSQAGVPTPSSDSSRATARGALTLTLKRSPLDAKVYIDNREVPGSAFTVAAGSHELVTVAPGFYGDARRVTYPANERMTEAVESVDLEQLQLPSEIDYETFLKLADASTITKEEIAAVRERTLQIVLSAKVLNQTGDQAELDRLNVHLEQLSRSGDVRARVASMLIEGIRLGRISGDLVTDGVIDASERGDAMASFFAAAALRDDLSGADAAISPSSPKYLSYCERLRLASAQGWTEIAEKYIVRDKCPSRRSG